jgi:hypothetical protein
LYFSLITAATVGYGEIHPITADGKLLVLTQLVSTLSFLILFLTFMHRALRTEEFRTNISEYLTAFGGLRCWYDLSLSISRTSPLWNIGNGNFHIIHFKLRLLSTLKHVLFWGSLYNKRKKNDLKNENILLVGSLLLFVSIIAGKTSYKFVVPTFLLFLAIGMLAGSNGIGGIHFDNPQICIVGGKHKNAQYNK